jgi:hypothetical protein
MRQLQRIVDLILVKLPVNAFDASGLRLLTSTTPPLIGMSLLALQVSQIS